MAQNVLNEINLKLMTSTELLSAFETGVDLPKRGNDLRITDVFFIASDGERQGLPEGPALFMHGRQRRSRAWLSRRWPWLKALSSILGGLC